MRRLLVLFALLAGCAQPAAPSAAPSSGASGFALADCSQMHLIFPTAAEPFARFVPQGFAMKTEDPAGQTVNLVIELTGCPDARMAWVQLPVTRDGLEGEQFVPVVAYLDPPDLAARVASWSPLLRAQPASITMADGSVDVATANESYHFRVELAPQSGDFPAANVTRWAASPDAVDGRMVVAGTRADTVGQGVVAMTYSGNGGAPPTSQGGAHVVAHIALHASWEAAR